MLTIIIIIKSNKKAAA